MVRWIKNQLGIQDGDSRFMGLEWRIVSSFGLSGLAFLGWVLEPQSGHLIGHICLISVFLILAIMGEFFTLALQDNHFRYLEIKAIALGGLIGFLMAIWGFLAGGLMLPPDTVNTVSMTLFLAAYVLIRGLYADYTHQKFSKED